MVVINYGLAQLSEFKPKLKKGRPRKDEYPAVAELEDNSQSENEISFDENLLEDEEKLTKIIKKRYKSENKTEEVPQKKRGRPRKLK